MTSAPSGTETAGAGVPRRGLVLGGGGVLGGAWMIGALQAIEQVHGWDVRTADVIVGTSAGSVLAGLLARGVSVAELRANQLGEPVTTGPLSSVDWDHDTATGGATPPRPHWGPGSAELVRRNARTLRKLPPTTVLASLVPQGRGSLREVGRLMRQVAEAVGADPEAWPDTPQLRVAALDFGTGRRVCFGEPGYPDVPLPSAVMASCAVPGWFAPVQIDGRRYVDGGAWSSTNVDLATRHQLDEVMVVAPLVSFAPDSPPHWRERIERRWRARVTRRCLREVALVHAQGAAVTVLGPGPEDLAAFGENMMAVQRRRAVIETSLRTSAAALLDPEPLPEIDTALARTMHPAGMVDTAAGQATERNPR